MVYELIFANTDEAKTEFWNLFWKNCDFNRVRASGIYANNESNNQKVVIHTEVDEPIFDKCLKAIFKSGFFSNYNGDFKLSKSYNLVKKNEVAIINFGKIKADFSNNILLDALLKNTNLAKTDVEKLKKKRIKLRYKLLPILIIGIVYFASTVKIEKNKSPQSRQIKGKKFVQAKAVKSSNSTPHKSKKTKKQKSNNLQSTENKNSSNNNQNQTIDSLLFEKNINQKIFENNNTFLHLAVINGRKDLVKKVLEKGIDINSVNNLGDTALHIAVKLEQ